MKSSYPVPLPKELDLEGLYIYSQMRNCHPVPIVIPAYFERVELMIGGVGEIRAGTNWREVMPGDLIWNKPGDATIARSDLQNPYRCLAVTLKSHCRDGLGMPRFSKWDDVDGACRFSEEVVQYYSDETFDRTILLNFVFGQLLFRVSAYANSVAHQARVDDIPLPLRRVLKEIEINYAAPCRLDDLARIAEWSQAHLHDVCQARLKASPHQLLLRRRLKAAQEKLKASLQPIKQISAECGFSDMAAFAHCFKIRLGISPSQYRKHYLRLQK